MIRKNSTYGKNYHDLRNRAEAILRSKDSVHSPLSTEEARELVHELHTYQIELELQNDELRRAQIELEESRRGYSDLYDFAPVGYITVSAKGLIIEANLTAADMLGEEKRFLLKQPLSAFIFNKDQEIYYHCRRVLLELQRKQSCELRMLKKDGSLFYAELKSIIRTDLDGDSGQFRMVITDISERKAAEEEKARLESQLRQAQKMQAVGTLAGGIAHEFNNILGIIMGCTELAIDDLPHDSYALLQLTHVLEASHRAGALVKQILNYSRRTREKRSPLDLCLFVEKSIKLLQTTTPSSVQIILDIDKECDNILADPIEIHQIIMNLCANSVDSMNEKGILTIRITSIELTSEQSKEYPELVPGRYSLLTVRDTGEGMEKKIMERIFEPFFTTKEVGRGTGMGLSLVYSIVQSYGGAVRIDSKPGVGTAVHIYIPTTEMASENKTTGPEKLLTGNERILLIEDDRMLAEMGKDMLERLGYSVTMITNSIEALKIFQEQPDKFDLVITDQIMPYITGEEISKKILSIRPDTPIILITGYSTQMDEKKAKAIGIKAFAMKPIVIKDLAELLRKVLDDKTH